ncbi:MAG: hypothetical protein ACO1SX_19625 [Actinomycetota bacterium]
MNKPEEARRSHGDVEDPVMERLVQERRPGEIESGMLSGSDDGEISATERFEGEITEARALELLSPDRSG